MARPPRIEYPGAVYYVTSRAGGGRKVFRSPGDPLDWLNILGNICHRYNWVIKSYCLMPDHYHLVVRTDQPTLSIGMRQLNGIYTQNYNERYSTAGKLFKGRFRSVHVQEDFYLEELVKYVLDSPLRAGFTKFPFQYKWSSCRFLKDAENRPDWLSTDWCTAGFIDLLLSADKYRVNDESGSVLNRVRKQIYLGDVDFEKRVRELGASADDNPRSSERKSGNIGIDRFVEECDTRDEAIAKAYYSGEYSMKEIGEHFSLHYSTVSRIIKAFEGTDTGN